MIGLIFFAAASVGLGGLLPLRSPSSRPAFNTFGLRFVIGFAMLTILLFVGHVVFLVDFRLVVFAISALSAGVIAASLCLRRRWIFGWHAILHPGLVLVLAGALAILINGGVDYIPTTNDEFRAWLGGAQIIHFMGGYDATVRSDPALLPYASYAPGWRLIMMAPWQFRGVFEPGLSAAAPFVLHAALAGLFFDVVQWAFRREFGVSAPKARLWAWAATLLFLAAEGAGRLWPLYLLIEPPQIHMYVAVFIIMMLAEDDPGRAGGYFICGGLALAAAYILKVAALTVFVAVVPAVFLMVVRSAADGRFRKACVNAARVGFPMIVIAWMWSAVKTPASPFDSPTLLIGRELILGRDYLDLAERLFSAITAYILGYKTVLLAAALGGCALGWRVLKARFTVAALVCFGAVYFTMLAYYHFFVFGDYYFKHLASVPRYSRVVAQTGHAIGLLMLTLAAVRLLAAAKGPGSARLMASKAVVGLAALAVAALGSWQARQLHRSVVDVTERRLFSIDGRVMEMRAAAEMIEANAGSRLPAQPYLVVLDQGSTPEAPHYARFFARRAKSDGPGFDLAFRTEISMSWRPYKADVFSAVKSADEVKRLFLSADVIWPLRMDDWLTDIVYETGLDESCRGQLKQKVLFRNRNPSAAHAFECRDKPPPFNSVR